MSRVHVVSTHKYELSKASSISSIVTLTGVGDHEERRLLCDVYDLSIPLRFTVLHIVSGQNLRRAARIILSS